ncbi:MAG: hypothetical protein GNW80_06730 [Asgard group archaeon]|nr:hypothetical protein [Asgard group archaeon]
MKKKTKNLIIIGFIIYYLVFCSLGIFITNEDYFVTASTNGDTLYVNFLGEVDIGVGYKIRLENERAYVSSNNGVEIIDIQNPTAPSLIGTYDEGAMGFDVKDNILFTVDANGLIVVNATNANALEVIGTSDTGQWAYNVRLNNTLVFAISEGDIDVYDITDLNNPLRVGQYLDTGRGNDIIINGETAYYADPDEGLEVINVSDHTNPVKIRTVSNTHGAWDLCINNDLLYLGCHGAGLRVLDISNPTNPAIIKQFNDGGEVYGVCGNDTYIFLGDLQEGVEVLNYTSSYTLPEIASYVATPHDIDFNENFIYLADQDNGFILLELSPTQNTNTAGSNLYFAFLILPLLGVRIIIQLKHRRKNNTKT